MTSPLTQERRPHGETGVLKSTATTTTSTVALQQRRAASRRLPPLQCGHSDPLECLAAAERVPFGTPEPFGLSEDERRRHGNDLVTRWRWSIEEVEQVLGIHPKAAVA